MPTIQNNLFSTELAPSLGQSWEPGGNALMQGPVAIPGDGVSTVWNPIGSGSGSFGSPSDGAPFGSAPSGPLGSILGMLSQLISMLQSTLAQLFGGNGCANPGQSSGCGGQYFQNASASSTGDPHDAFSGSPSNGANVSQTWDNMQSHPDLLSSNSFAGEYRVSTQASAPNAAGITYNQSATIATDGGASTVTMNADGTSAIVSNGQTVSLASGQSLSLDGGETVTANADGSLTVVDQNGAGGQITTTLARNGQGVDVRTSASNVDLGGYLANHADGNGRPPVGYGPIPSPFPPVIGGNPILAGAGGSWSNPSSIDPLFAGGDDLSLEQPQVSLD
ncbi:MAG: hypothetical protein ACREM2_05565 [Vulcanimicrobiaceae bacterium]